MKKILVIMVSVAILGLLFAGCSNMLNVTLPSGDNSLSRSNGAVDIIYGIQRSTGDIYSLDVANCSAEFLFSVVAPPTGTAKPNGLAYDEFSAR